MREIKFRAWNKTRKCFTYFSLRPADNLREVVLTCGKPNENFELMQYTGLKDKNGKEIYEGDIVHLGAYNNCQKKWLPTYKCEVKFTLEHGGYAVSTPYTDNHFNDFEAKYCEIIGNIYENPGLLESKK